MGRLESLLAPVTGKHDAEADRVVSHVIINAMSAWAGFAREYYLSCAIARPKTMLGNRVSHSLSTITDERLALLHSISVLKGKTLTATRIAPRDEPAWQEKRALSALSVSLSLSNASSVVSALSYHTTFFDEMPTVRNFFAHRSHGTAEKVQRIAKKYGAPSARPTELINTVRSGATQTIAQEWLGDMKQIGLVLCQ
jgi:hypothetical protein